jgi:2-methylcitrate dehydratase PrpD
VPGATVQLANFVSMTRYDDLPGSVIELTKMHILDALAAGLLGAHLPWSQMVAKVALARAGSGFSSVFGHRTGYDCATAAMVNGAMIGAFEVDDGGPNAHPGGTAVPAALALAEELQITGRQFLLATALGYEVVLRIGDAQTAAVETERGFHSPAANGPFAAATAAGKLLGLDPDRQAWAYGVAGSYSGGLAEFAWDGAMTKRIHLGKASRGGLEAALLTAEGLTGPATILEGRYGFLHAFSPASVPERLLADLGRTWLIPRSTIKLYPGKGHSQAFVAAIQQLKRSGPLDVALLSRIHISAGAELLQSRYLDPEPTTEMGVQYSLPYSIAVALCRDLDDPLDLVADVVADVEIRRVAKVVTWQTWNERAPAVEASLELSGPDGGVTLELGAYRGSPRNPAGMAEVSYKFRSFSRHALDARTQDTVIELVRHLDALADVRELGAALRPA